MSRALSRVGLLLLVLLLIGVGVERAGWLSRADLARGAQGGPGQTRASVSPPSSPWHSPGACAARLATRNTAPRQPGRIRIGTWNIRWFPDGGPGDRTAIHDRAPSPTHVGWLACAIAWLDVDVLAVQEIKATARATRQAAALRDELDALTGGAWQLELDRCAGRGRQHVGLLYNRKRLAASSVVQLDALNPHGGACDQQLRPGLGAYFRHPGGVDFHLVSVHLKSGPKRRSYDLRQRSLEGLVAAYRRVQAQAPDADVVVAGDFNTMGCRRCSPSIAPDREIARARGSAQRSAVPFRWLDAQPACSEYYRGRPGLLDHIIVANGMREVGPPARVTVHGFCADARCRSLKGTMPRAYYELSDHCPAVLDIDARDID